MCRPVVPASTEDDDEDEVAPPSQLMRPPSFIGPPGLGVNEVDDEEVSELNETPSVCGPRTLTGLLAEGLTKNVVFGAS